MPGNAIEYFATLGKKDGPFECDLLEEVAGSGERNVHPSNLWQQAITDVAVVHPNEKLPEGEGWQLVTKSVEGKQLVPPHVAYRRRKDSHKADHIISIMHVLPGQIVPDGYTLVIESFSKQYSAWLNDYLGYIAIKKSSGTALEYLKGKPFVEDIQIVVFLQDEEVPEKYIEAGRVVENKTLSSTLAATMSNVEKVDPTMVTVAYCLRSPVGLCDLSYKSYTLDRYPERDYEGMQLPVKELPTFAFPRGLHTEFTLNNNYPIPKFFTFVFTNATGGHLYAACLRFWEKVSTEEVSGLFENIFGDDKEMTLSDGTNMFAPKVICVVSTNPFYRAMRRYLRQIYSLSLSQTKVPLEFFISTFVGQVPVPVPGGRPFHVSIDAALVSETSRALPSIQFSLPHMFTFPHIDIDFAGPLRCLSVENVLVVFILLLREAKITFICDSGTILTETMETFRSLLFPLEWSQTFISRLPIALSGLLQAPGGYMVGLHMEHSVEKDRSTYKAKEEPQQGLSAGISGAFTTNRSKKYLPEEFDIWIEALIPNTYVVDLSGDGIFRHNGSSIDAMSRAEINSVVDSVPQLPRQRLQRFLQTVTESFRMGPEWNPDASLHLLEYDSAFDMHRPVAVGDGEAGSTRKRWKKFPSLEVRDAFMVFMIDVLGEYTEYIVPPPADFSANSFRTFQEMFLTEPYIENAEPKRRVILQKLTETQMFSFLLQERNDGMSSSQHFFDMCAQLLRRLGLNYCSNIGLSHTNCPIELPSPLHKMLVAYLRLQQMNAEQVIALRPIQVYDAEENSPKGKRSMFNSPMSSFSRATGSTPPNRGASGTNSAQARPDSVTKSTVPAAEGAYISLDIIKSVLYKMDQADLALVGDNFDDPDAFMSRRYELDEHLAASQRSSEDGNASSGETKNSDKARGLELQDCSFGPLIVPGPLSFSAESVRRRGSVSMDKTYQYKDGWPNLQLELLNKGRDEYVHDQVKQIAAQISFSSEKVEPGVRLLVRHPVERLSFCYTAVLTGAVSFFGGKYSIQNSTNALSAGGNSGVHGLGLMGTDAGMKVDECLIQEVQPVVSTILEAYSASITRLCLRVLAKQRAHQSTEASAEDMAHDAVMKARGSSTGDILQMLGVLSHLERIGLLVFLHERMWRQMLLACSMCGGNLMRRVSRVLYACVVRFCGHSTNTGALTYGQYVTAVSAVKCTPGNDPVDCGGVIDTFLHLEEMGLTWFLQRSVLDAVDTKAGGGITSPYQANKNKGGRSPASALASPTPSSSGTAKHRRGTFMMMEMMLSGEGEGPSPSGSPVPSPTPQRPALTNKDAIYDRLKYRSTTSATYVAESLSLTSLDSSSVSSSGMLIAPEPTQTYINGINAHTGGALITPVQFPIGTEDTLKQALNARLGDIHRGAEPLKPISLSAVGSPVHSSVSPTGSARLSSMLSSPAHNVSADANSGAGARRRSSSGSSSSMFSAINRALSPVNPSPSSPASASDNEATAKTDSSASSIEQSQTALDKDPQQRERRASVTDRINSFFGFSEPGSGDMGSLTSPHKKTRDSIVAGAALAAEFSDDEEEEEEEEEEAYKIDGEDTESDHNEDVDDSASDEDVDDSASDAPTIRASHDKRKGEGEEEARPRLSSLEHRVAEVDTEPEQESYPDSADEAPNISIETNDSDNSENDGEPADDGLEVDQAPESSRVEPDTDFNKEGKEVKEIQEMIHEALFLNVISKSQHVVTISARAKCDCLRELTEEDFMSMWVGEHRDKKRFRLNVHENSQDIDAAHKVVCVGCSRQFSPMLHVTCYRAKDEGGVSKAELETIWEESVPHLSPYGLLFKHEQLMVSHGTRCVCARELHSLSPQVYWVSQFYSARLRLPSGLSSSNLAEASELTSQACPEPVTAPILVGSRQSFLYYRAKKILFSSNEIKGAGEETSVPLDAIYPDLDESSLASLAIVQSKLNGSREGLREALLELSKIEVLVDRTKDKKDIATSLYNNLLILAHLGGSPLAATNTTNGDVFSALNGPTTFDLTLYSSLKQAVDPLDLQFMQVEEEDIVDKLPSRAMMGFRQAWGLLV